MSCLKHGCLTLIPHTHLVSPYRYMHAAILQCLSSCICLCNNGKWCLPSFVRPSSCSALLFWCFLLNVTPYTTVWIGGPTSREKLTKKGWSYFQGWAEDARICPLQAALPQFVMLVGTSRYPATIQHAIKPLCSSCSKLLWALFEP